MSPATKCLASLVLFFSVLLVAAGTGTNGEMGQTAHARNEIWKSLPKPAPILEPATTGFVPVAGAKIYYATFGSGPDLILLHGGMGNLEHWGSQIPAFAAGHRVIAIDSRGHGRSTRDDRRITYRLMAEDTIAVMDALSIAKASIVGWSDGGVIGLEVAMRHPERLERLFIFGANADATGMKRATGTTFARYKKRAAADYRRLSPTPRRFSALVSMLSRMWSSEPRFSAAQLRAISAPVAVAVGEYDEIIKVSHIRKMGKTIPDATTIVMKQVSHFGLWQDPDRFNTNVLGFLAAR